MGGYTLPPKRSDLYVYNCRLLGAGFRDCHRFRTSLALLTAHQPEGFCTICRVPTTRLRLAVSLRLYRGLPQGDLPPLSTLLVYHIVNQKSSVFRKKLVDILHKVLLSKLCKLHNIPNSPRPQMWSGRSKFLDKKKSGLSTAYNFPFIVAIMLIAKFCLSTFSPKSSWTSLSTTHNSLINNNCSFVNILIFLSFFMFLFSIICFSILLDKRAFPHM